MIRARLHIAALLICGLVTPTFAGSGLIRLTDRDDLFGWEAVGRVEIGENGYCTGVLIAPNLVLTAAHCVYDRQNNAIDATTLTFRAGLQDGNSIADSPVARLVAHKGYDPHRPYGADNIRKDAALLELAQPIPTAIADPFVLHRGSSKGRRVSVVSYGQGRDEALSWQKDCGVLGQDDGLIAFDCNITFGSSGAPVFVRDGTRARILTLISGGNMNDGDPMAFGMDLPPLVAELKRDLRAAPVAQTASTGIRRVKVGQGGGASGAKFAKP